MKVLVRTCPICESPVQFSLLTAALNAPDVADSWHSSPNSCLRRTEKFFISSVPYCWDERFQTSIPLWSSLTAASIEYCATCLQESPISLVVAYRFSPFND
jgi:hypothetical protein